MQSPTTQEMDELDQMDMVIGLSDAEARYLLQVWRACAQTVEPGPKHVTDEFRRTIRVRRQVL